MPNEITIFEHEKFGELRMMTHNGEPWFVAKDVALALEYQDTDQAIRTHCVNTKNLNDLYPVSGTGVQSPKVIDEGDMYALIMGSTLPMAKAFKRWVCSEVLPSIRKTGSYTLPEAELPTEALPALLPAWEAAYAFAKKHGYHGNQAILTASKVIKKAHGVDIPALMGGTNLVSENQQLHLTPTELGHSVGLTAQAVNNLLESIGLQTPWRRGIDSAKAWKLTNAGKAHGEYLDVGKPSGGAPVQQIKWFESTLAMIENACPQLRLLGGGDEGGQP